MLALAAAYAGRFEEAMRDAQSAAATAAQQDALNGVGRKHDLARVYIIAGRKDDAFAVLRDLMSGPMDLTLNELRFESFWLRVKDDPRFEEILRSAKSF